MLKNLGFTPVLPLDMKAKLTLVFKRFDRYAVNEPESAIADEIMAAAPDSHVENVHYPLSHRESSHDVALEKQLMKIPPDLPTTPVTAPKPDASVRPKEQRQKQPPADLPMEVRQISSDLPLQDPPRRVRHTSPDPPPPSPDYSVRIRHGRNPSTAHNRAVAHVLGSGDDFLPKSCYNANHSAHPSTETSRGRYLALIDDDDHAQIIFSSATVDMLKNLGFTPVLPLDMKAKLTLVFKRFDRYAVNEPESAIADEIMAAPPAKSPDTTPLATGESSHDVALEKQLMKILPDLPTTPVTAPKPDASVRPKEQRQKQPPADLPMEVRQISSDLPLQDPPRRVRHTSPDPPPPSPEEHSKNNSQKPKTFGHFL
ncbi:BUD13 homolog [Penaeus monodon]|uniref:BUD13 homolog n=1 Tax=Penaeus monodon TaxID=6687 RepID=UPI0018A76366|nr:BUD13 homolog [Penaeus monodon]